MSVKLCIATPCYGDQCYVEYMNSLIKTIQYMQTKDISVNLQFLVHESLITRARNNLVAKFLSNPQLTHLMFIDADISWNPEDIYNMIKLDKDIIGGVYPKKMLHLSKLNEEKVNEKLQNLRKNNTKDSEYVSELLPYLLNYVIDTQTNDQEATGELDKVKYVGTGFMLIKRSVLEKMIEEYKDTWNYHPHLNERENKFSYALFDCAVKDKVYLSEDFLFCQRWIDMGGEIWAYYKPKITHIGLQRFAGNPYKRLFDV